MTGSLRLFLDLVYVGRKTGLMCMNRVMPHANNELSLTNNYIGSVCCLADG
jgi:hypothetical protein